MHTPYILRKYRKIAMPQTTKNIRDWGNGKAMRFRCTDINFETKRQINTQVINVIY